MRADEQRAKYLAAGPDDSSRPEERLDLIRDVLAEAATWAEPPTHVVHGLLAAVADDRRVPSEDSSSGTRVRWPVIAAAVGGIAAVIALVFSTVSVLNADTEIVLAMSGTELELGAAGQALARPTGSGWWIRLELSGLPPAPDGSFYQGWVWSDDGQGVSIGTFHLRGGEEPVVLWSGVELAAYPSIWVTLQNEGEGPEASDLVVMTGRLPDEP
ncbi:MAG TPA: anti-sigma factor [Acidimicrobiia bacterium]|jgi:hypothetical protein